MAALTLGVNSKFEIDGRVWRVLRSGPEMIDLQDDLTNETRRIAEVELFTEIAAGTILVRRDDRAALDDVKKDMMNVRWSDLPPNVRASTVRKRFFITAFQNPYAFYDVHHPDREPADMLLPRTMSRDVVKPFAAIVQEAFAASELPAIRQYCKSVPADFDRAPSFSTYAAWVSQWNRSPFDDVRLLASRYDRRGSHTRKFCERLQDMLNEATETIYLTLSKGSKVDVFCAVASKVASWNRRARPADHIGMISQRQVSRYIDQTYDRETICRRRRGDRAADAEFKMLGIAPKASRILETVEMDHTTADVDVVDDLTGRKIGRPTVTFVQDRRSRLPLGFEVGFEPVSVPAVMKATRSMLSDKTELSDLCEAYLGKRPDYDYPGMGRPDTIFVDRGPDFTSEHLQRVALELDIKIEFEPVACPNFKGKLERWHKTMQAAVSHPLPGATPPPDADGYRRDADGRAYITLNEYRARLWYWITMVYAKSPHGGLARRTPLEVWREDAPKLGRQIPVRTAILDDLCRLTLQCGLSREGVRWKHLRWTGPVVREIMALPSWKRGSKATVYLDEDDLSAAEILHPLTLMRVPLEATDPGYMTGCGLHQHRLHLAWVAENREEVDLPGLLAAREVLREQAFDLINRNDVRNRQVNAPARYLRIDRRDPGAQEDAAEERDPEAHAEAVECVPRASETETSSESDELPRMHIRNRRTR